MLAAHNGHLTVVKVLVDAGADLMAADKVHTFHIQLFVLVAHIVRKFSLSVRQDGLDSRSKWWSRFHR